MRIPIYVTSNSRNSSNNGSRVAQDVSPSIKLPNDKRVSLLIHEISVWWNTPNISTALNNNRFTLSTVALGNLTLLIPKGLYSVSDLEETLNELMITVGFVSDVGFFSLVPDSATQKITLYTQEDATINWGDGNTENNLYTILGFDPNTTSNIPSASFIEAPNRAKFNNVNSLVLHSDIASGVVNNSIYGSDIVAQLIPDVSPGSQIYYRPFHSSLSYITQSSINNISWYWTDENGQSTIDFSDEPWTLRGEIQYDD